MNAETGWWSEATECIPGKKKKKKGHVPLRPAGCKSHETNTMDSFSETQNIHVLPTHPTIVYVFMYLPFNNAFSQTPNTCPAIAVYVTLLLFFFKKLDSFDLTHTIEHTSCGKNIVRFFFFFFSIRIFINLYIVSTDRPKTVL